MFKKVSLIFLFIFIFASGWSQKKNIIVFDEYANVIYSAKNKDSIEVFKLKAKDFNLRDNESQVPNLDFRIHIYFGHLDLSSQSVSQKVCNSIWYCDFISGMRLDDFPYNESDTFCYPTGIDSLPDGFWVHGILKDEVGFQIGSLYNIVNFKIDGLKLKYRYKDSFNYTIDTIMYRQGYIRYKSNFSNTNYYNYTIYNECGKKEKSEYYENGKFKMYTDAKLGYGIFLDELGNINEVWTIKNNLTHGYLHKFDENGNYIKSVKYEYGKPQ